MALSRVDGCFIRKAYSRRRCGWLAINPASPLRYSTTLPLGARSMLSKEITQVHCEKQVHGLIDIDELIPALERNVGVNVEID